MIIEPVANTHAWKLWENLFLRVSKSPMNQSLQLIIKSSIFDRERQLTIDPGSIEFYNKDQISTATKILKSDITGLRHGIKWINGYQFVIGRIYCIDIMCNDNEVMKIRLKSLYGIRKRQLTEKYVKIINALYDNFFDDISRKYLTQFANEEDFQLSGLTFTPKGILFDSKSETILWEDVGTQSFQTYYAIFSKSNPNKYKAFEYLTHWNTGVLYSVSREILKEKGYWSE